jgi:hypothetical protein
MICSIEALRSAEILIEPAGMSLYLTLKRVIMFLKIAAQIT